MRKRLIELLNAALDSAATSGVIVDNIADYLLDKGVIVLPAYIGQTVWIIGEGEVLEDVIYEIGYGTTQSGEMKWLFLVEDSGEDFYDSEIGKTVFFTAEAAEEALKAKEGEHETAVRE